MLLRLKKILKAVIFTGISIFFIEILALTILVVSFVMFGDDNQSEASTTPETTLSKNYE